jgi:hypothetical protein
MPEAAAPEAAIVINEMIKYMTTVLEQPNPAFEGLPVCPFAQKYRLQNLIQFHVHPFSFDDLSNNSALIDVIKTFKARSQYEVLFVIHPDRQALRIEQLQSLMLGLNEYLKELELVAYGGHPDDSFNINGVYTRREPYINFTVQTPDKLKWASQLLEKTSYYKNWSPENLKAVGIPRD